CRISLQIDSSNLTSTKAERANSTIEDNLTTSLAASSKLSHARIRISDCAINAFASSTFVPEAIGRTTTGILRLSSRAALMIPCAITSHRIMPPKMFTKIAIIHETLCLSSVMMRNASVTCCTVAPPPTSKKLAGSPPCSLIISIVAIAKPAPFT
ncbi:hypothetical protein Tcan_01530, partial [Toxocara canis]